MEFRNLTPFSVMNYKMLDTDDKEHHVIAMKVKYSLVHFSDDIYQAKIETNESLCIQDQYLSAPLCSGVRSESDLSPFKPYCDVIIIGSAIAPDSKPVTQFPVSLTVTENNIRLIDKTINIFGKRCLKKINGRWELQSPDLFTTLPLGYEYAFGGECKIYADEHYNKIDDQYLLSENNRRFHPENPLPPIAHDYHPFNPAGKGYIQNWYIKAKDIDYIEIHRIEDIKYPFDINEYINVITADKDLNAACFMPAGFGVITRSWQPRLSKAGTYDDTWINDRHPYLPKDFDFNYWNSAPADQQISYPGNDITIRVTNMTHSGSLQVTLPGHRAFLLARLENGPILPVALNLDTIILDTDTLSLLLTFRQKLSTDLPLRVLEARFETNLNAPLFSVSLPDKNTGDKHG